MGYPSFEDQMQREVDTCRSSQRGKWKTRGEGVTDAKEKRAPRDGTQKSRRMWVRRFPGLDNQVILKTMRLLVLLEQLHKCVKCIDRFSLNT